MTTDNPTDVGPAPTPPNWCEPEAEPEINRLTAKYGGGLFYTWERTISRDVWISVQDRTIDGRIWPCAPTIHYSEPGEDGIDPAATRRLAAELLNAADLLEPPDM